VLGDQSGAIAIMVHEPNEDITARRVDEAEATRATELFNRRFASQQRPRVAVTIDPAVFDRYVGSYKLESGQVINVERDGDQFFYRYAIPGREKIRLYPESETEYFDTTTFHAQITFMIDPQGQVTRLISHQGGWNHPAMRIEEAEARRADAATAERARGFVERRADERRPREAVAVDTSVSDRDLGIYDAGFRGTFGPLFTITREGDQLFAQMGQPKLPIFPEREHTYFFKGIPAQLTFEVDGQGRPPG